MVKVPQKRVKTVYMLAICLLFWSGRAGAGITVHTDLNSWRSGLPSYVTETFNDTVLEPGIGVTTVNGAFASNLWYDRLTTSGETTTWTFSQPINSWGADFWNLAEPGGFGTGIQVYLDGVAVPAEILNTQTSGFWGVTSTINFSQVLLTTGTQSLDANAETYEMDNMSYAAPVPSPSAMVLSALGVGLAGWFKKRQMLN
jgi:hypothetical protein